MTKKFSSMDHKKIINYLQICDAKLNHINIILCKEDQVQDSVIDRNRTVIVMGLWLIEFVIVIVVN